MVAFELAAPSSLFLRAFTPAFDLPSPCFVVLFQNWLLRALRSSARAGPIALLLFLLSPVGSGPGRPL